MASIKFYLKGAKKNGILRKDEVSVIAKFTIDRQHRFEITTDEKIAPRYWDFKSQCVKSTYRGHYEVNIYLSDFKTKLLTLYREHRNLAFPEFRKLVFGERTHPEKKTLFTAYDQFLEAYRVEKDKKTLAKYQTLKRQLETFDTKYHIDLKTLDFNFYDAFKRFLLSIPNPFYRKYRLCIASDGSGEYNLVPGDIGEVVGIFDDNVYKYFQQLKAFLNWSVKRGYDVHPSYKTWEIIRRVHAPISLTARELEQLENAVYTSKALEVARDYLVFECRTGQRISDIKRFDLKDLKDDKWTFTPRKGNRLSSKTISVHFKGYCAPALCILQKYNFTIPRISEQKLNENIKRACKAAGIDNETITYRWAANKRIKISGFKYEFISSHTGRKTFITLALQAGIPVEYVMALTGITEYKTIRHYKGEFEDSMIESYLTGIQDSKAVMRKAQ